jgi:competence protein ComFC
LKYGKGRYALEDLINVALSAPNTKSFLEGSILVPVPLHPFRQMKRTYNQSELIARALSKAIENVKVESCLQRTRWTNTQTRLTFAERQKNLRNVFSLKPNANIDPLQRYVVVDDVFTTGSTLNSCCKTLLHGGVRELDIFALGHG